MKTYKALDLFCGGGGAALGLLNAGFNQVVGIDIQPHPHYPGTFIQGNIAHLPVKLETFDFVWASPPCQLFSVGNYCQGEKRKRHKNWIPFTRYLLQNHPYTCIENVPNAPIRPDVILTGPAVGLTTIQRNRHFEISFFMLYPRPIRIPRKQWRAGKAYTITTSLGSASHFYPRKERGLPGKLTNQEAKTAMGIPQSITMSDREIGEAVPPPYSEFIGHTALNIIRKEHT